MKKETIIFTISITIIVILLGIIYKIDQSNKIEYHSTLLDSIQKVITKQQIAIDSFKNDTANRNKIIHVINSNYDTVYKDYSKPNIVSDDSITSYISRKIHHSK